MADEKQIRCGDVVLHRPTGERWLVAYADYERGDLARVLRYRTCSAVQ